MCATSVLLLMHYGDWLSQAPEGKFPVRRGDAAGSTAFEEMWATLPVGVDRKAPLGDIYPKSVIDDNARVMSQVIRQFVDGELSIDDAAAMIVEKHKAL